LLYIIFYLFLTMLNYREMEMTYLMKSGVRVYAMYLGPCGSCTSLYSYPLGLASCIYQLPETWYRARVSTSLPCAAATSLPCCRRRAQGRRQRQVPRPPGATPARSAPTPRPSFLCPRRAPPGAAPRPPGAPRCPPPPALPLSHPTRRPRAPPAHPGLPSSHGCRVPSPLFLSTGRVSLSTRRRPSCRYCCAQAAVGGRAHCRRRVPHRDGHRNGPCGCGRCPSCGGCRSGGPSPANPLVVCR
jgi:hypothetical protein